MINIMLAHLIIFGSQTFNTYNACQKHLVEVSEILIRHITLACSSEWMSLRYQSTAWINDKLATISVVSPVNELASFSWKYNMKKQFYYKNKFYYASLVRP